MYPFREITLEHAKRALAPRDIASRLTVFRLNLALLFNTLMFRNPRFPGNRRKVNNSHGFGTKVPRPLGHKGFHDFTQSVLQLTFYAILVR
jgi:hypothetical protein